MYSIKIKSILFILLLTACSGENTEETINDTTNENDKGEITMSEDKVYACLLYTSPSPRDATLSRMPSSA